MKWSFLKDVFIQMIKRRMLTYVVLTMLLFVSFLSSANAAFSSTLDEIKDQISSAGDKQEDLQDQLDAVNSALQDKQQEYESYSKEYAQLAKDYANETSALQKQLDELEVIFHEMESLQNTIAETEAQYEEALDLFYQRAVLIYRYSTYSSLQMFIECGNMFEYAQHVRLMKDMLQSDKATMEELILMKKDLDAKKELVEITSLDLKLAVAEKEALVEKIKNNQAIVESDLTVSRDAITRLEAEEAALEQEAKRLESEILELQRRYENLLSGDTESETLRFLWPAPSGSYISSYYGYRTHPISGLWKMHYGIDIPAAGGTDIIASEDGVVVTSAWNEGGYGWYVVVYHGDGISTLYAHANKLLVKVGDQVKRGQVIALVGTTGASKGNHLHYEVRVNGVAKDPLDYLDA